MFGEFFFHFFFLIHRFHIFFLSRYAIDDWPQWANESQSLLLILFTMIFFIISLPLWSDFNFGLASVCHRSTLRHTKFKKKKRGEQIKKFNLNHLTPVCTWASWNYDAEFFFVISLCLQLHNYCNLQWRTFQYQTRHSISVSLLNFIFVYAQGIKWREEDEEKHDFSLIYNEKKETTSNWIKHKWIAYLSHSVHLSCSFCCCHCNNSYFQSSTS